MKNLWEQRREQRIASKNDARTEFDVDYSRIIHSFSFRRLQGKTQILNLGDGDFYRTRLTHSLEVAQISAAIANQLRKKSKVVHDIVGERTLMESVGLIHDIGHPPFGHGGEVALNFCMSGLGGFEGNAHTIRLLSKVEKLTRPGSEKVTRPQGLNLTRRCLLASLKYPSRFSIVADNEKRPDVLSGPSSIQIIDKKKSKPPKCYFDCDQDVIDWLLEPLSEFDREEFQRLRKEPGEHGKTIYKSFDCSIMNIADDIAYGVHDLEDAVALELLDEIQFEDVVNASTCRNFLLHVEKIGLGKSTYSQLVKAIFGKDAGERKRWIGHLVGYFVTNIRVKEHQTFDEPLLAYEARLPKEADSLLEKLKEVVRTYVILGAKVQHLEFKGQQMVVAVFEAMASYPDTLLPDYVLSRFDAEYRDRRVICDHVAGMTDTHLLKTYERLFSPRMGSIFDQL